MRQVAPSPSLLEVTVAKLAFSWVGWQGKEIHQDKGKHVHRCFPFTRCYRSYLIIPHP